MIAITMLDTMKEGNIERSIVSKRAECVHHGDISEGSLSELADDRVLLWKIDLRLLPLL